MIRRALAVLACLAVLSAALGACAKRKPQVAPGPAPAPPEPAASIPGPATEPEAVADPLEGSLEVDDLAAFAEEARRQGLLGDVYFAFDRADLPAESRDRLAANARFFKDHPDLLVTIEGHCDERGTNEYNLALGERRASAALRYLLSLQAPAERLTTASYGEERPVCTESEESCWSRNRRAHFRLSGRLPQP